VEKRAQYCPEFGNRSPPFQHSSLDQHQESHPRSPAPESNRGHSRRAIERSGPSCRSSGKPGTVGVGDLRPSRLSREVPVDQVERSIRSCSGLCRTERRPTFGRRAFAVLTLPVRLGLAEHTHEIVAQRLGEHPHCTKCAVDPPPKDPCGREPF
jgi:hypothetical protein